MGIWVRVWDDMVRYIRILNAYLGRDMGWYGHMDPDLEWRFGWVWA